MTAEALRAIFCSDDNPQGKDAFHSSHSGPRWTYGLQNRPYDGHGAPRGPIHFSWDVNPSFRHGVISYPFPLTEQEIESYELTLVGSKS